MSTFSGLLGGSSDAKETIRALYLSTQERYRAAVRAFRLVHPISTFPPAITRLRAAYQQAERCYLASTATERHAAQKTRAKEREDAETKRLYKASAEYRERRNNGGED